MDLTCLNGQDSHFGNLTVRCAVDDAEQHRSTVFTTMWTG